MVAFLDSLKSAASSVVCTLLRGPDAVPFLGEPVLVPGGALKDTIEAAKRVFCNDPTPVNEDDLPSAPFAGGQCPGVEYEVSYTRNSYERLECDDLSTRIIDVGQNSSFTAYGPITGPRRIDLSQGDCGPKSSRLVFDAFDEDGEPLTVLVWSVSVNGLFFAILDLNLTVNSVTRVDGQPDTCGDPPVPPPPPYSPVVINKDIDYTTFEGDEITEEGDFTIFAPVFIGGNLIAPVTVDVGGLSIPLEVNLSTGDVEVSFDFSDSPADISDENPDENPTDDAPDVEESTLIYGLVIYSTPTGPGRVSSTVVGQSGAPVLFLPRTGNVWFQVPVGERVSWVGPIPVQAENQLVMVPDGLGASGYRLVPSSGWEMTAVRVGKPPCGCTPG